MTEVSWYRRGLAVLTLASNASGPFDLGGVEAAWTLSTVKVYPFSISPIDGVRVRIGYLQEDPALGSDVSLGKLTGDLRTYTRLFGETDLLKTQADWEKAMVQSQTMEERMNMFLDSVEDIAAQDVALSSSKEAVTDEEVAKIRESAIRYVGYARGHLSG